MPRLEPLDVVGHVAVVGLLVEQPLRVQSLAAQGLIPIDAAVRPWRCRPARGNRPGRVPRCRPWPLLCAPGPLQPVAQMVKPAAEMAVTGNVLLIVEDAGLTARGGWAMLPDVEKRFSFDFTLPAGWLLRT